jgi:hypothetical protein
MYMTVLINVGYWSFTHTPAMFCRERLMYTASAQEESINTSTDNTNTNHYAKRHSRSQTRQR